MNERAVRCATKFERRKNEESEKRDSNQDYHVKPAYPNIANGPTRP